MADGVDCSCSEIYCDEAQQTSNYYIDCSLVEGGTILNFCDPTPVVLTPESTDLDFLMYIPDIVCGVAAFENPNAMSPQDSIGSGSVGQAPTMGASPSAADPQAGIADATTPPPSSRGGGDSSSSQSSGPIMNPFAIGAAAASAIIVCLF